MTTKARLLTACLAVPVAAAAATAQLPGLPGSSGGAAAGGLPATQSLPYNGAAVPPYAPVPPVGSPVGIGSYPPLPTSPTLGSFLGLSSAQREYRQRAAADTPFGELRSRIRQPISDATGGLIPPIPPKFPALAELQDPGAVGAAAKVKLDREGAKKRIKAVQYLGTVDCHYWPEAEDGLVTALRADRNEWVRLAAAQTLLKGCCCTKKTILALTLAATCSNADGNPAEKSPRVVAAAQAALSKCLEGLCAAPAVIQADVVEPGAPPGTPEKKGEGERSATEPVSVAKPGPGGAEKGAGGLAPDQIARPTTREVYERAAARPWGEMIAFSRAHLAKAPPVPVEYLQAALAEVDAGPADEDDSTPAAPAGPARKRPTNLYDALFSDTNVAKVPAPRPQPTAAPAPTLTAAAPARPAPAPAPVVAPTKAAVKFTDPAVKPTDAPAEPARMAISIPAAKPATPALVAPAVRQAAMTTAPKPPATPTGTALGTLAGKDGAAAVAAVERLTPGDVVGPVPSALLGAAEEHADPAARAACVRALARGKATSPAVLAGLERLVSDRNVDVRVEAAVALNQLKGK